MGESVCNLVLLPNLSASDGADHELCECRHGWDWVVYCGGLVDARREEEDVHRTEDWEGRVGGFECCQQRGVGEGQSGKGCRAGRDESLIWQVTLEWEQQAIICSNRVA